MMVTVFTSSLGKIAWAVACLASLSWAHDSIMGLYCDWSSLICAVIFKLAHDCAGCFAVILGHQAVPCLLQYMWGWSVIILVIFDCIMTPVRIGLLHKKERLLPRDSISYPEFNSDNIA